MKSALSKVLSIFLAFAAVSESNAEEIRFTNLAEEAASGIVYQRARSALFAVVQEARERSLEEALPPGTRLPRMTAGLPGVAIFDHDGDGDLDIYVTNGPGAANSLFSNQLAETGKLRFVDRGVEAGVDATAQDSAGVCFGDVDNDGDHDLLVLSQGEPNRFFENVGAGRFAERTGSTLAVGVAASTSCSMGDVNGDGLLDVVVANHRAPGSSGSIFDIYEVNQLFLNLGDTEFEDVSESSGIRNLVGLPPQAEGKTLTWAIAMVDVDLDGDVDIVQADDQGPIPTSANGGLDLGYLHVLVNDGDGIFTDRPIILDAISAGSWMGLGFGDLNCDGHLDLLGSNFGDYGFSILGLFYVLGDQATRVMLGQGGAVFADQGIASTGASAFGWGNAIVDYDNDGDQDLIYQGGFDMTTVKISDNPGIVLDNQGCSAEYVYNPAPLRGDYLKRNVHGMAVGDLNADGFPDIVTASDVTVPEDLELIPLPVAYGTPLDSTALYTSVFQNTPEGLVWKGIDFGFGDVTVEVSSADNGNGWVSVRLLGSVGLTGLGAVNRDGIGAVVSITPHKGKTVMKPIVGGSSYLSQHSLETTFGLGAARHATLEVLWPGGVRNRLYLVRRGQRLVMPEIPCSFDDEQITFADYRSCVRQALDDLKRAGVISRREKARLFVSALTAFLQTR